jgi:L-histidine N-alpha-methyltransferase
VLEAAYDDSAGVTAALNRNVLTVVNRELDANFVPESFDHVAFFDRDREWIEMRLRARLPQRVVVGKLGLRLTFAAGEELRTEISAKFTPERIRGDLAAAGMELVETLTDDDGLFALNLARVRA